MSYELSVGIPVFNTDIRFLVQELHRQCARENLAFEILCLDDGSAPDIVAQNQAIQLLPHTRYQVLPENLGRVHIRHQLALQARFPFLLLVDNDCQVIHADFISQYLQACHLAPVLIGGTCYQPTPPPAPYMLRWKYGKAREEKPAALRNREPYHAFYLNNICLPRELFLQFPPPVLLQDYGHEDSFFGRQLELAGIKVLHLDNPVLHAGLEPAALFLSKTRKAIANFYQLYCQEGLGAGTRLVQASRMLQALRLQHAFRWLGDRLASLMLRNLQGRAPRIWVMDLYKLYYFTLEALKNKKPRKQERGFSKR